MVGAAVLTLVVGPAWGDEPPAWGYLAGRVIDANGRPMAEARVSTAQARPVGIMVDAWTDAEGRFHLSPLAPVHLLATDVFVDARGWARVTVAEGTASVYPERDTDLGVIRLERGRVFTGQVLDVDGDGRFTTPPLAVGRLVLTGFVPERQRAHAGRSCREACRTSA